MNRLPPAFATLEPFVARFAVTGSAARAATRGEADGAERAAFYAIMRPLLATALDHLDRFALDAMPDAEARLMDLALMFAHVSLAEEMQGPAEPRHAVMRAHMPITHSPAGA